MQPVRTVSVGLVAYAGAYLCSALFPISLPAYDPAGRVWSLAPGGDPATMRLYGQMLFAIAVGLAAGGWSSRWRSEPSPASMKRWVAWAATSWLLCGAYYTWHNWP